MEEPEFYQFKIDTANVAELWRRGSVISSWLLDLTAAALYANPGLEGLAGRVSDSGEGRWTVKAAVDIGVPAPVLAASLFERFASRDEDHFANQVLSAMRQQFGGHQELPAGSELEAGGAKADKVSAPSS
jgi:6-phosphogluconate dehydrogenase